MKSSYSILAVPVFLSAMFGAATSSIAGELDGIINLNTVGTITPGARFQGISGGDQSGDAVSSAGDVNGDGIDDLIIGAFAADPRGNSNAGESYVIYGGSSVGGTISLDDVRGSVAGARFQGIAAGDFSGRAVTSAGDVNGDGIDDLIIGASSADPGGNIGAGESYLIYGGSSVDGTISLDDVGDSVPGARFQGISIGDSSGRAVSSAGDINGDGIDDLIIGAESADPGGNAAAGESYLIYGGSSVGGTISLDDVGSSVAGARFQGIALNDFAGSAVSSAGDVNGDGIDDLIIGASRAHTGGISNAGESYLIYGGSSVVGTISLDDVGDSVPGARFQGIAAFDSSGSAVSSAGDVNGDGIDDLIIGAPSAEPDGISSAGESYLIYGGSSVGGTISLDDVGGSVPGARFQGISTDDDSGRAVSSAGDVNGDGIDDLIIGASLADPGGILSAGESYLIYGGSSVGGTISLDDVGDSVPGARFQGIAAFDYSGSAVSSAGDVNGDGIDDLIIGARDADPGGNSLAGESYLIYGRPENATYFPKQDGEWDNEKNWQGFQTPQPGDNVVLNTDASVTISGPSEDISLETLEIGGGTGTPTLMLQGGAVITVSDSVFITENGQLTGDGVLDGLVTNSGTIIADNLTVTGDAIDNGGVIQGNGRINAFISNSSRGEIRVSTGETMQLTLPSLAVRNYNLVSVVGGTFESIGSVSNETSGDIFAQDANLRFRDGLANQGRLLVSFGNANIFGDVHNDTGGQVIVSGDATATFLDEMDNDASIIVTDDSSAVFFGDYTGTGAFGGGGSLQFHGGFFPGASPAKVEFEADLKFESTSTFGVEIEGLDAGTGFDQIVVDGAVTLGGNLEIEILEDALADELKTGGFREFDFLHANAIEGDFLAMSLNGNAFDDYMSNGEGHFYALSRTDEMLTLYDYQAILGDVNADGMFDQTDLDIVMAAGHFEDDVAGGADWMTGDWNLDGDFDQMDIDLAMATGMFGQASVFSQAVPEPNAWSMFAALGCLAFCVSRKRRATIQSGC